MPTVIVTGGAGALGQGISKALIAKGFHVTVVDINPGFAAEAVANMGGAEVAAAKILDVNDLRDVTRGFAEIVSEHDSVAALVNCAGGSLALRVPKDTFVNHRPEHWARIININLFGTFNCCYAVAPYMKRERRGSIVNTASGAGLRGGPPVVKQSGAAVYSATKAGVIAFTQALAQELGPYGIRVNAIAPGRNESRDKPLAKLIEMQAAEEAREPGSGRISPLGRFGRPSDIGDAVSYLISEQASYVTGICLDLTGGIQLH